MKIRCVEIRVIPVRGRAKVYALSALTMGPQSFAAMLDMMTAWMSIMDRRLVK